jgi:long-subunit fatty acid transport protein
MNRLLCLLRLFACACILTLLTFFLGIGDSNAQSVQGFEIPSSMNPVGSGARALGMGGAFIAVADDATAASWNPGGLIQLETPEVSVVGACFRRNEDNTMGTNPEASGNQDASRATVNYLSAAYPFSYLNRNMIVSINYQNLYDFTRQWKFPLNTESGNLTVEQQVDFKQEGSLSALGLAYAIQILPRLSFGLTLNFWEDGLYQNGWEETARQKGTGTHLNDAFTFSSTSKDKYEFSGFNINLGILWQITDRFVLGAVFKSPFTADLKNTSSFSYEMRFPDDPSRDDADSESREEDEELDMPMSYGVGVSYGFSDRLTASADIYRTEWQDYVLTDHNGRESSPITGESLDASDISATNQMRIGCEYLFIRGRYIIPLRGGVFYDPMPSKGGPDDFYGFSLGSGVAKGRLVFDAAYQYRFGNDVGTAIAENYDFSQDVNEHTVYTSVIVHF